MAYTRTDWVSGETPLSADNMNNIEDGIEECQDDIADLNSKIGYIPQYEGSVDTPPTGGRIFRTVADATTGTLPTGLDGNSFVIASMCGYSNNVLVYGGQLAFGFGSNKVAVRNHTYGQSASWSAWRYI